MVNTAKTHDEIMCEDGFELICKRKRRRLIGPKFKGKAKHSLNDIDSLTSTTINEENIRLAVQNAHSMIDEYLSEYIQKLLNNLQSAIDPQFSISTVRAIGIGNFHTRGSDSTLQMAVLERILEVFTNAKCFYQEPRCIDAEQCYLKSKNICTLQADSLQRIPKQISGLITKSDKSIHLVYMVHFDHYGLENLLDSFQEYGALESLVFIGNTVPCDYNNGILRQKLEKFCEKPLELPPKTSTSSATQRDKVLAWFRKAFANTSIYSILS